MLKLSFNTTRFKADLKAFEDKVSSSLELTTKDAAEAIKTDARHLDSDVPSIANSIEVEKSEKGFKVVKGKGLEGTPIWAFSEFGTGNFAAALLSSYPEDWKAMAMQYYVNGKGRLPAKPALYPAFVKNTVNIADEAAKKIG